MTEAGNWEHSSILNLPKSIPQCAKILGRDEPGLRADLAADRAKLLAARELRVPPGKDTKVLISWNGLMLAALAEGSLILDDPRYAEAASKAASFLLDTMRTPDGRLLHSFKDGQAKFNAYLDDYANLIDGLTRLFEATGESRWIEAAVDLSRVMVDEFHDTEGGGFFYTGRSHEALIARQKDAYDNATPSGNAMAATALARLAALTGRGDLADLARSTVQAVHLLLEKAPTAAGQSLVALDYVLAPSREFAVIAGVDPGEFREAFVGDLHGRSPAPQGRRPLEGHRPSSPMADLVPLLRADRAGRPVTEEGHDLRLREFRLPIGARGRARGASSGRPRAIEPALESGNRTQAPGFGGHSRSDLPRIRRGSGSMGCPAHHDREVDQECGDRKEETDRHTLRVNWGCRVPIK